MHQAEKTEKEEYSSSSCSVNDTGDCSSETFDRGDEQGSEARRGRGEALGEAQGEEVLERETDLEEEEERVRGRGANPLTFMLRRRAHSRRPFTASWSTPSSTTLALPARFLPSLGWVARLPSITRATRQAHTCRSVLVDRERADRRSARSDGSGVDSRELNVA